MRGLVSVGAAWIVAVAPGITAAGRVGVVATGDFEPDLMAGARSAAIDGLRLAGHEPELVALESPAIAGLRACVRAGGGEPCRRVLLPAGPRRHWLFLDAERERDASGDPQHVVTGWWLADDGQVLSGDRRYCPRCTPKQVEASTRELIAYLLEPRTSGLRTALIIRSSPSGAVVAVDGRTIGVTAVEYAVRPGTHRLRVERDGHRAEERQVSVAQGATTTVDVALSPDEPSAPPDGETRGNGRRIAGWAVVGGGAALLAGGALLVAVDRPEVENGGYQAEHRDSMAWGLGLAAAGVGAVGVGAWLLLTDDERPPPAVAVGPLGGGGVWVQAGMRF